MYRNHSAPKPRDRSGVAIRRRPHPHGCLYVFGRGETWVDVGAVLSRLMQVRSGEYRSNTERGRHCPGQLDIHSGVSVGTDMVRSRLPIQEHTRSRPGVQTILNCCKVEVPVIQRDPEAFHGRELHACPRIPHVLPSDHSGQGKEWLLVSIHGIECAPDAVIRIAGARRVRVVGTDARLPVRLHGGPAKRVYTAERGDAILRIAAVLVQRLQAVVEICRQPAREAQAADIFGGVAARPCFAGHARRRLDEEVWLHGCPRQNSRKCVVSPVQMFPGFVTIETRLVLQHHGARDELQIRVLKAICGPEASNSLPALLHPVCAITRELP